MQRYYWIGNIAKARVISEIVSACHSSNRKIVVFDYGAGRGGDWPTILKEIKNIRLFCYEPDAASFQDLKKKLAASDCVCMTGKEIDKFKVEADFIVSFSVLEHVRDRAAYLANAKKNLSPEGVFYLNYDDGHFRFQVDLTSIRNAFDAVRASMSRHTPSGEGFRSRGKYLARVKRSFIDSMLNEVGFNILQCRYENIDSFKELIKTVPDSSKEDFCRFWLEVEARLNLEFATTVKEKFGDTSNLWRHLPSRTLKLVHAHGPTVQS